MKPLLTAVLAVLTLACNQAIPNTPGTTGPQGVAGAPGPAGMDGISAITTLSVNDSSAGEVTNVIIEAGNEPVQWFAAPIEGRIPSSAKGVYLEVGACLPGAQVDYQGAFLYVAAEGLEQQRRTIYIPPNACGIETIWLPATAKVKFAALHRSPSQPTDITDVWTRVHGYIE